MNFYQSILNKIINQTKKIKNYGKKNSKKGN